MTSPSPDRPSRPLHFESSSSSSRSSSSSAWSYTPPRQTPRTDSHFRYFSRRSQSRIKTTDLPFERGARGHYSPWGIFYGGLFLTVPLAYIYILLVIFRELCVSFPETIYEPIHHYLPYLSQLVHTLKKSSTTVEVWCVIEGVFYVLLKLHIMYLQRMDPLERSLRSAPMLEAHERRVLWDRMMATEKHDPVTFVSGWFFDEPLENVSKYDLRDFICWALFEGRNQEHLTVEELHQLDEFVDEMEWSISLYLYGTEDEEMDKDDEVVQGGPRILFPPESQEEGIPARPKSLNPVLQGRPKKMFRFDEGSSSQQPNFFSNLYENYKQRYEQYRSMMETTDFHPVQDFRNFMEEKRQRIVEAEESAVATASTMCEHAYHKLVSPGSNMDKQLSAFGHATQAQLTEAWNSVKEMRGRLEMADVLSKQRKRIRQQMKSYRLMLSRMRSMSTTVPSNQMAALMRKITECNEAMERLETSAKDAFVHATGYARKNMLSLHREPQRYAKYSTDPLLGIATYPLGFHLLILAATEIPLRVMLQKRGFERLIVGQVAYYYHPGTNSSKSDDGDEDDDETEDKIPIVFVHGIGIGLITYMPLIDRFLESGRPILLPEIPYVSGFRPWLGPNAVLPPAAVASTMTTMLASHGFLKGTFVGHSYGTSWVSYMCKYAPTAIAAAVFIDPICFCLHVPHLTKKFVYHRPDPGNISYMVRTDVTVNWTIQRSFPWTSIVLFTEDIAVPCSVFLSENDALVPSPKVEQYLKSKGALVKDFVEVDKTHFESSAIANVTIFRGHGHGDWTDEHEVYSPSIASAVEVLCTRASNQSEELKRQ